MLYSIGIIVLLIFLHINMETLLITFSLNNIKQIKNSVLLLNGFLAYSVFTNMTYYTLSTLCFVMLYSFMLFLKLNSFKLKEC